MPNETSPDRAALVAFGGAVLIGGTNFVAVKFSNNELAPLFGAAVRFAIASALFFVIAALVRAPLPRGRAFVGAALYGSIGFGIGYAALYYALLGLSAGTASVMMASTPLFTLVLAVLHRQERFSARGIAGGILAILGIGLLSGDAFSGAVRPIYFIASLIGVIATAESSVLVKGYPRTHPMTTNAVGMALGAVILFGGSLLMGESWALPQTTATWLVLAWLIVLGSVGLFALFLFVLGRWSASASVYAITLMPVVAVTLGALLFGEDLTLRLLAGGALVLAAVYIGALSREKAPLPEAAPAAADAKV